MGGRRRVSLRILGVAIVLVCGIARADEAPDEPLPPAPGTLHVELRITYSQIHVRGAPRLREPAALERRWLMGGAQHLLRPFPRELWSCARRRGRAVDPQVAAVLPASLHASCFYEGHEVVAVRFDAASRDLVRLREGGFVARAAVRRLTPRVQFHGVLLEDRLFPRTIARREDSVVLDDPGAEGVRETSEPPREFLATVGERERWMYVDRDAQALVAFVGTRPVMATLVSTAGVGFVTPTGEFRIRRKARSAVMQDFVPGNHSFPYSFPDVPFAQYYTRQLAVHGALWHDEFGTRRSHGCVNVSVQDAQWLFQFTDPATERHPGSRLYVFSRSAR